MSLTTDFNSVQNETAEATAAVSVPAAAQAAVPATAQEKPANKFAILKDRFETIIGAKFLPMEASTSCSVESAGITVRAQTEQSAGEFLIAEPQSISSYHKLDLGTQGLSDDEKKLQVCCWDNETVTFGDESFGKDEFMQMVKSRGFGKASWKERAVLYVTYLASDKPVNLTEDESLLAIYMSPSALREWNGFVAKCFITPSSGDKVLKIKRVVRKTNSGNSYPTSVFERVDRPAE